MFLLKEQNKKRYHLKRVGTSLYHNKLTAEYTITPTPQTMAPSTLPLLVKYERHQTIPHICELNYICFYATRGS